MTRNSETEDFKKRERVQRHFWNEVGAVDHISLPRLKNALTREFKPSDDRFVQVQLELMQTEARIRVESRVKVWIRKPESDEL
jgi:hypothetical protein